MLFKMTLLAITGFMFGWNVASAEERLAEQWHGTWAGKLKVFAPDGTTFERAMQLTIQPLEDSDSVTWTMVSEFQGKTTTRNYQLDPEGQQSGEFTIDERNGIVLNAHLRGKTILTYFLDGDILIAARYELRDDGIHMELSSVETNSPRVTATEGSEIEIKAYRLGALQAGLLSKELKAK